MAYQRTTGLLLPPCPSTMGAVIQPITHLSTFHQKQKCKYQVLSTMRCLLASFPYHCSLLTLPITHQNIHSSSFQQYFLNDPILCFQLKWLPFIVLTCLGSRRLHRSKMCFSQDRSELQISSDQFGTNIGTGQGQKFWINSLLELNLSKIFRPTENKGRYR